MNNQNFSWEFGDLLATCKREGYVMEDLTDQKLIDWKANRGIMSSRDMATPKLREMWLKLVKEFLKNNLK